MREYAITVIRRLIDGTEARSDIEKAQTSLFLGGAHASIDDYASSKKGKPPLLKAAVGSQWLRE